MKRRWYLAILVASLAGCDFKASLSGNQAPAQQSAGTPGAATGSADPSSSASPAQPDRLKFFIRGKRTSNLSEDRKTITLSIEAQDPDGGEVSIEWASDKPSFGNFNSTRGKDVQWTVSREGTFKVAITATVKGSLKKDDPDTATFVIPVEDGKIKATEIAPEITLSPQSVVLFRPLPTSLNMSADQLATLGVKTKVQPTATSYIYDPECNCKVKNSGEFQEIKWVSDDPTVAVVDDNGLAKPADGSAIGQTSVGASSKTNSASRASALVSVQYLDTAISLSYPTATIYLAGKGTPNSVTIAATVQYSNPTDRGRIIFSDPNGREITWKSSNPSLAQVSANGTVTPLADASTGDLTISAVSNYDPSKSANVTIKVRAATASNVNMVAQ